MQVLSLESGVLRGLFAECSLKPASGNKRQKTDGGEEGLVLKVPFQDVSLFDTALFLRFCYQHRDLSPATQCWAACPACCAWLTGWTCHRSSRWRARPWQVGGCSAALHVWPSTLLCMWHDAALMAPPCPASPCRDGALCDAASAAARVGGGSGPLPAARAAAALYQRGGAPPDQRARRAGPSLCGCTDGGGALLRQEYAGATAGAHYRGSCRGRDCST